MAFTRESLAKARMQQLERKQQQELQTTSVNEKKKSRFSIDNGKTELIGIRFAKEDIEKIKSLMKSNALPSFSATVRLLVKRGIETLH